VVEAWRENPYWQYFCGETQMQWGAPCEPSDLVHFRHRIGEAGMQLILAVSIQIHGPKAGKGSGDRLDRAGKERDLSADSKLYRRVIVRCWKLADREQIQLRRRYRKEVRKHLLAQRGRGHWRTVKIAQRATRKLKTIAGRLVRELGRKLCVEALENIRAIWTFTAGPGAEAQRPRQNLQPARAPHLLRGQRQGAQEIRVWHQGQRRPDQDRRHHRRGRGHEQNIYDGHTLPEVLQQTEALTGSVPAVAIVDRGYRGTRRIGETEILVPGPKPKSRRRITPHDAPALSPPLLHRTGHRHLKSDYLLARNYLKGFAGDTRNLLLAAAAWNFNKWLRWASSFWLNFLRLLLPSTFPPSLRLTPF